MWPFRRRRPPVVLFRTPWQREDDGWSIAARRYARMMQMAGVDVRLSSWNPGTQDAGAMEEVDPAWLVRPSRWDVYLFSSALPSIEYSRPTLEHVLQCDGKKAFHVVLERQQIEPELADYLKKLDGVWAQCSANHQVLRDAGVDAALHLHPYFDDDPWLAIPAPKQHRNFLWVGRNEPRKAPDNLVRAFMRAFQPGEATLTLKLSSYGGLVNRASLQEVIEDQILMKECRSKWHMDLWREDIKIFDKKLSADEMLGLYALHDVYCSASRGEGLDLPAYQAKLAGRTLVTTDSGGPRDFIGDGDVLVPATGSMPAAYEYYWGPGATYADYRLEDLVAGLQQARATRPRGERLPGRFRAKKVAKGFGKWIRGLT